jgi:hypothetical protein
MSKPEYIGPPLDDAEFYRDQDAASKEEAALERMYLRMNPGQLAVEHSAGGHVHVLPAPTSAADRQEQSAQTLKDTG